MSVNSYVFNSYCSGARNERGLKKAAACPLPVSRLGTLQAAGMGDNAQSFEWWPTS